MHVRVIGNIITIVAPGRRRKREQPESGDAQVLQIVELLGESAEISHPVAIAVEKRADMQLIKDGVLEPERIVI
jgi:hypothetical protein